MTADAIKPMTNVSVPQPNSLLVAPILPTMLRLSMPNMVAMLATALVAVAETSYVGAFGTSSLAGLVFVFPMVMLQQTMSAGAMGGGVSSAVSRALGAGDVARASRLAWHAIVIGCCFGLTFTLLFLVFGESLYRHLGGRGVALEQALAYSNIVFLGAVGIWLTNTMAAIVRGSGNMKVPSATLLSVAAAQVAMGGALGFGWLGLPRLGIVGVALGQVLAFSGGAVVLFCYLVSGRGRVRLALSGVRLQWDMFRDILKVGALACISPLQTVLSVLVVTRLVSGLGTEALAGYGLGARLEFLLIPIAFAIGVTSVPLVGMAIGAGNVARARRVAWTGGSFAAVVLGVVGVVVALWPHLWSGLFTHDTAVLASAGSYFAWAGPFYVFYGLGLCLYFASQGAGKVLGPVLAGTLRLAMVIGGGWWLASIHAPVWMFFALIGAGMAVFGAATAAAIYWTPWGPRATRQG